MMSQQQRLSQEMTNTPRRCSVSKSRVGFKTDLRFPPPSFLSQKEIQQQTDFRLSKYFCSFLMSSRTFLKLLFGAVPPWMVKCHGFFSTQKGCMSLYGSRA